MPGRGRAPREVLFHTQMSGALLPARPNENSRSRYPTKRHAVQQRCGSVFCVAKSHFVTAINLIPESVQFLNELPNTGQAKAAPAWGSAQSNVIKEGKGVTNARNVWMCVATVAASKVDFYDEEWRFYLQLQIPERDDALVTFQSLAFPMPANFSWYKRCSGGRQRNSHAQMKRVFRFMIRLF